MTAKECYPGGRWCAKERGIVDDAARPDGVAGAPTGNNSDAPATAPLREIARMDPRTLLWMETKFRVQ